MTELGARWKALDAKKKAKFENMAKDGKEAAKKAEAAKANADANPTKEASKEQPQKQQRQQKQPQGAKSGNAPANKPPAEKRKNPAEDARFAHLAVSPGNLSKLLKAATKTPKVKVPAAGAGSGAAAAAGGDTLAAGKKQRPPKKKDEVPKDNDDLMTVRCGGLVGSYIISEKMVLCDGKKMTPAKFEEKSGVKTRRWKRTIKVDPAPETGAKPLAIGDFFSMMGVDFDEATKQ